MKKSVITSAIVAAMGGISMSAQAALTSSTVLNFNAGTPIVTGCLAGSLNTANTSCTLGAGLNVTDMSGSYFTMDTNGNGTADISEKNGISENNGVHIGSVQSSSGQHTGGIDGSESPTVDNPWNFNGNTGMHTVNSAITDNGDGTLDFSGWGVNWGLNGPSGADGPTIPMGGDATITCDTAACADGESYVLDMAVHVPAAFTSVPYTIHLEGTISAVPVPAAAWLFGSGLVGLAGVARRRRS